MFGGVDNEILYSAQRVSAYFVTPDGGGKRIEGTGFYVQDGSGKVAFVTNRHIVELDYARADRKYASYKLVAIEVEGFLAPGNDPKRFPISRQTLTINVTLTMPAFGPVYEEDVCVIYDPKIIVPTGTKNLSISYGLPIAEFATDSWINDKLSICDFVAFPGFPPWHDKKDMRPILRTGTIASDPRSDYSETSQTQGRRIAYEAFSFGGSSGSPVIATQKGLKASGSISVSGYREGRVVGINAGHLSGENFSHSGISYFIKSSAILDLIKSVRGAMPGVHSSTP